MVKKSFAENKSAKIWLKSARHDLDLSFLLNRDKAFTDTICYFCHQTVEKTLKALFLLNGFFDFPHTHDLEALMKQCKKLSPDILDFRNSFLLLNRYYLETKYPVEEPVNYPREEAEKAIEMAEEIYEFVEKKLKTKI